MASSSLLSLTLLSCILSINIHLSYSIDTDCSTSVGCQSDLDCSLNGICNTGTGVCTCDNGWTGKCCSYLDFQPAKVEGSYRHPNTSTWGGNIIYANNEYHMWIAEMAPANNVTGSGSCGLTTWGSNSQITHVSASSMDGPYIRQEVAVGIWSHNPIVRLQPDGTYVLYHIGGGSPPNNPNPPGQGYCNQTGTSPCGEQSFDQCEDPCQTDTPIPGYTCYNGYCSGDLENGNCGNDIAEPTLNCDSYSTCAVAAAQACANTTGCVSFGLCSEWGFGKAKLFSAGSSGLIPNSQWAMWIQNGKIEDNSQYYIDDKGISRGQHPTFDMFNREQYHVPLSSVAPNYNPIDGSCTIGMHIANSTNGPWTPYTNATITPCGYNNPAPWVHPNGTVYFVATDQNMGLWRADSWQGPYTLVTTGACGGGEDPSLFIDKRGHFHCMFHRSPFSNPDIAIGHAYSLDGFTWYVAAEAAANSTINYDSNLGTVIHGKRERPHPYMNSAGDIVAFVSGVCINPACNPLDGGSIDPTVNCSSAAQYYRCDSNSPNPGYYDRTYTLVQGVGPSP